MDSHQQIRSFSRDAWMNTETRSNTTLVGGCCRISTIFTDRTANVRFHFPTVDLSNQVLCLLSILYSAVGHLFQNEECSSSRCDVNVVKVNVKDRSVTWTFLGKLQLLLQVWQQIIHWQLKFANLIFFRVTLFIEIMKVIIFHWNMYSKFES